MLHIAAWKSSVDIPIGKLHQVQFIEVRGLAAAIWSEERTGLDVANILVSAGLLPVLADSFSVCNIPASLAALYISPSSCVCPLVAVDHRGGRGASEQRGERITIYTYVAMEWVGGKVRS